MPSQWDHKADKDLLLAIIDEGSLKSIVWQTIAAKMKAKDYSFTHEACRQHFQKIRKESRSGSSPAKRSAPSAPSTPRKSQKMTPKSSKSSSFASDYNDDDDDEEVEFTPIKRQFYGIKTEDGWHQGQTASAFKVETVDESGRRIVDLENDDLYDDDH